MCGSDGVYATCMGEITPVPENCLSSEDQDCNGSLSMCTGSGLAAWAIGGPGNDYAQRIAVAPDGSVIVGGQFHGTVAFGMNNLTAADTGSDGFVAKYDMTGKVLWAFRLGGPDDDVVRDVALDASGNVLVVGTYKNRIDFDAMTTITSDGSLNGFVASFDGTGKFTWGLAIGSPGADQAAEGVAVDSAGNVFVAGDFAGSIDVVAGSTVQTPGDQDGYVLKLDAMGHPLWIRDVKDQNGQDQFLHDVATDDKGSVYAVGEGNGNVDFGQGPVTSALGRNLLVAGWAKDGTPSWGKTYGDASDQRGYAIAVDALDEVLVTGTFGSTIQFDTLTALKAKGQADLVVAKLDATGKAIWSQSWGGSASVVGTAVTSDQFGEVLVGGYLTGPFDFFSDATKALPCSGAADAFIAKLDPNGVPVWSHGYGDSGNAVVTGVATYRATMVPSPLPPGAVAIAGFFGDVINPGKGPLTSAGAADCFVAWLAP
jgi:hypothetical protein